MKPFFCLLISLGICITSWSDSPRESVMGDDNIQAYVAGMRAEFRSGKVGVLNEVLDLTNEEAGVFWPIYQRFENELFAIGDRRLALIEDFAESSIQDTINDAFANRVTAAWFQLQDDYQSLLKSYVDEISRELSQLKAAQFLQLEHRFDTVADLIIATEIPLIK